LRECLVNRHQGLRHVPSTGHAFRQGAERQREAQDVPGLAVFVEAGTQPSYTGDDIAALTCRAIEGGSYRGDCRKFWGLRARRAFSGLSLTWGKAWPGFCGWFKIGTEGEGRSRDVMAIERPDDITDIAHLGLTLSGTKRLLATLQQEIVAAQLRDHAVRRPTCSRCGGGCRVKDYQDHVVVTLFGQVTIRLPRFRSAACCGSESGIDCPSHCRSTPELDRLQAHLAALVTYRTAADLLEQMFPVDAAKHPETVRRHALKVGEALGECATTRPAVAASAVVVTLDSTLIRSCEQKGRHLEVRVGNVETASGGRQVFGSVVRAGTDIKVLLNRNLDAVGRTGETELTAFTDGCSESRNILATRVSPRRRFSTGFTSE
jgi:hypothetical protein